MAWSKAKRMREGNISIILDSYDDLFSDFDPRHYAERAVSTDFLQECRMASRDKGEGLELRLLVPSAKRVPKDEEVIRTRLLSHFQRNLEEKREERRETRREGALWSLIGSLLIATAVFFYERQGVFFIILKVILEPAGWFTTWTGLEKIFIVPNEKQVEYIFYAKMSKANIVFLSY